MPSASRWAARTGCNVVKATVDALNKTAVGEEIAAARA
jgi:ribosomal protein S5